MRFLSQVRPENTVPMSLLIRLMSRLRMSATRVRHYLIKLKLFEMGETKQAEAFDDMVSPPQIFEDSENTWMRDLETRLKLYEERYEVYCARKDRKPVDLHVKASQRNVIEEFQKKGQNVKKCENCDAISPAYRKDGFSKIFQKPLSKKTLRALSAMRLKLKVLTRMLQHMIVLCSSIHKLIFI